MLQTIADMQVHRSGRLLSPTWAIYVRLCNGIDSIGEQKNFIYQRPWYKTAQQ